MKKSLLLFCCIMCCNILLGQDIPWKKITQTVRNPDRAVFRDFAFIPYFYMVGPFENKEKSDDISYEYFVLASLLQHAGSQNGSTSFFQLSPRLKEILASKPEKSSKVQAGLAQLRRDGIMEVKKYHVDLEDSHLSDGQILAYWLHRQADKKKAIEKLYDLTFLVKRNLTPSPVTPETGKFLLHMGRPFMVKSAAGNPLICIGFWDDDSSHFLLIDPTLGKNGDTISLLNFKPEKNETLHVQPWSSDWSIFYIPQQQLDYESLFHFLASK